MNKIKLYFLAYFDFEVIQKALESLYDCSNNIEIHVLENKSEFTYLIKPFLLQQLENGYISSYYLFENNLANNAFEIIIARDLKKISNSNFFIVTDGDLLVKGANWLQEELNIMQNNNELFACGISLSLENLPINEFADAINWVPSNIAEFETFFEAKTGGHLLMLRTSDFLKYWEYREKEKLNFTDGSMANFCYQILKKKWAKTKNTSAIHLTWDSYSDRNHPYTIKRLSKDFKQTWHSKKYFSKIYVHTKGHTVYYFRDWSKIMSIQLPYEILKKITLYKNKIHASFFKN